MKAKEYYEKYKAGLLSADNEKYLPAARGLIYDLLDESKAVAEARHVRFDRGFIPVLREQIGKYKAIVRMFEKDYGVSPIRADGFEQVLEEYVPGVLKKTREPRSASRKVDTHTREG